MQHIKREKSDLLLNRRMFKNFPGSTVLTMDKRTSKKKSADSMYEEIIANYLNYKNEPELEEKSKPKKLSGKLKERQSLFPIWANEKIQNNSYVDHTDEFLDNSHRDVSGFISSADNLIQFIKKLEGTKPSERDIMIDKLNSLQNTLNSTIESILNDNYESTEIEDESEDDQFFSASTATDLDKLDDAYSVKSYASSHNESNVSYKITTMDGMDCVDCQFCSERYANLQDLMFHIDTCKTLNQKNFESLKRLPTSHFQLINNIIKCNVCNMKFNDLSQMKRHEKSRNHRNNIFRKNKSSKNHVTSHYIYCNSCRILIPDTFIQFKKHLENKEHISILSNRLSFDDMALKGYDLVISRSNVIKCLVCPRTEFKCEKETVERHCKDHWHKTRKLEKSPSKHANLNEIYCEKCDMSFELKSSYLHVNSTEHVKNVRSGSSVNILRMKNEYCVFCDKSFPNLKSLAMHLELNDCYEMKMRSK